MAAKSNSANAEIRLTAHAPERGRQAASVTVACACCSCCCCCLHSIGSLGGAVIGSFLEIKRRPKPVDPSFPFPFRRDELDQEGATFPISVLYWLFVLILIGAVSVYYFFVDGKTPPDPWDFLIGAMLALFFLPGVQLGASTLTILAAVIFYADKRQTLIRVSKITLWSIVGCGIGLLIMAALCGLMALPGLMR